VNIDEVVATLQQFTSVPVEIFTVNATTSIAEQIRLFNLFDILITPHGSHLANGIFTMRPGSKAIVEVAPFAFDRVFYSNFNLHLELGVYMMSTGHLTPLQEETNGTHCFFDAPEKFTNASCTFTHHQYPKRAMQHFITCSSVYQPRMCDTWVNITLLRDHMTDLFNNSLCRPPKVDLPPEATGPP